MQEKNVKRTTRIWRKNLQFIDETDGENKACYGPGRNFSRRVGAKVKPSRTEGKSADEKIGHLTRAT